LTDPKTAKNLRGLTHNKLKHFNVSKTLIENVKFATIAVSPCFKTVDIILQNNIAGGKEKNLVQFQNRELKWLPKLSIGDGLLREYGQRQNKQARVK